jgi:hypothetical protein
MTHTPRPWIGRPKQERDDEIDRLMARPHALCAAERTRLRLLLTLDLYERCAIAKAEGRP